MKRSAVSTFVLFPLCAFSVFAGPKIKFDSTTVNCGSVMESKADKIEAVFSFKNTGNEVLRLENVRPGCGCTVVKYDTTVKPGKTSKIESSVNIKGYHQGQISKQITVSSNAENEKTIRLTIVANVRGVVEISESFITLDSNSAKTPVTVAVLSQKKDLMISDVSFRQAGSNDNAAWQNKVPISVGFTFKPTDKTDPDGYRAFSLSLAGLKSETALNGDLVIKTNHPDKPEITVGATFQK